MERLTLPLHHKTTASPSIPKGVRLEGPGLTSKMEDPGHLVSSQGTYLNSKFSNWTVTSYPREKLHRKAVSKMVDQVIPVAPDLRTTPFPAEFTPGARNAVTTCLRIQPNEKITLITDEHCLTIAASIASELDRVGCTWNAFVLESLALRPLTEMPL